MGTPAKQFQTMLCLDRCQYYKSIFIQIKLDGRAEDRGIEPLRLLPAVQRFAGVPSIHTGSVLRSRACDE
jgi:hypothetical protein